MASLRGQRLKWQKPSPTGGPSPVRLLIQWFEANYAVYTRAPNKEKFLEGLRTTIEDAGHDGCTLRSVRSKVESLERQMKGEQTPSKVLKDNRDLLENVFSQVHTETPAPAGGSADGDGSDSNEENEVEAVNCPSDQEDVADVHTREIGKPTSSEDQVSKSNEEDTLRVIPVRDYEPRVVKRIKRIDVSPHGEIEVFATKRETFSVEGNDNQDEDDVPVESALIPVAKAQCRPVPASHLSSKEEIERIATLLRERHNLKQVGVPQEEIDRFLPLPDA